MLMTMLIRFKKRCVFNGFFRVYNGFDSHYPLHFKIPDTSTVSGIFIIFQHFAGLCDKAIALFLTLMFANLSAKMLTKMLTKVLLLYIALYLIRNFQLPANDNVIQRH